MLNEEIHNYKSIICQSWWKRCSSLKSAKNAGKTLMFCFNVNIHEKNGTREASPDNPDNRGSTVVSKLLYHRHTMYTKD